MRCDKVAHGGAGAVHFGQYMDRATPLCNDGFVLAPESVVAEAPWSVAEWAVALRFDNPRATVLVLLLSGTPLRVLGFQTP